VASFFHFAVSVEDYGPLVRTEAGATGRQTHERSECAQRASRDAASQSPGSALSQDSANQPLSECLLFSKADIESAQNQRNRMSAIGH
jgi:hypothetical protein